MSGCLSRSSYKLSNKNSFVNEEYHSIDLLEKKNITNNNNNIIILNNNNNNKKINSLRRTSSSADMLSEKWAQNNGVSMIKRVHSSENLKSLGEKNDYINEDIVNYDVDNKGSCGGAAFEDIWSSILSGKKPVEAGSGDPAPYVHPLVKRASSLSEKSLEICTESLGSETGSDGFSIPLTDPGDGQEGEEVCGDEEVVKKNDDVVVEVVGEKYNYNNNVVNSKKVNVGVERSFPPPLPSLVNSDGGSNLHMRTRRHGGRVVVEAVAVSTLQCFRAQREDGRLLLTFSGDNDSAENEQESKSESELESKLASKLNLEPDPKQFSDELVQKVNESSAMSWAPKVISVTIQAPKAMSMNKLIELTCTKSQSMWPRASNMTFVKSLENEHGELVEVEESARQKVVTHSLPPRPRMNATTITAPTTLNEYEYYWRNSPTSTTAVTVFKPVAGKQNNYFVDSVSPQVVKESNKRMNKFLLGNNEKGGEQEKVVLVGEEEYLVPFFRGCKESRRSLLFWEPYCIATS